MATRLTPEQLRQHAANLQRTYGFQAHGPTIEALQQAASDASVLAALRAWLDERHGEGHNVRDVLDRLDELEAGR